MSLPLDAHALPEDFLCQLDQLGIIKISGEEAVKYLQGQITADVTTLTPDNALLGAHCDFKGKTWSVFLLVQHGDDLLLLMHNASLKASLTELKKYGVFSKVEIEDVSGQWAVLGGAGEQLERELNGIFGHLPDNNLAVADRDAGLAILQTGPRKRYLLLLKPANKDALLEDFADQCLPQACWDLLDIQAGLPNIQAATVNEFVPQMMNLQLVDGISFDKGCYMGQEVVARTRYLGKNKRAAFILKAEQAISVNAGDTLEMQLGENWRRGGTVLRSATLGQETWILAVLANDTEQGACLRLKDSPDALFIVQPLPYALDK